MCEYDLTSVSDSCMQGQFEASDLYCRGLYAYHVWAHAVKFQKTDLQIPAHTGARTQYAATRLCMHMRTHQADMKKPQEMRLGVDCIRTMIMSPPDGENYMNMAGL